MVGKRLPVLAGLCGAVGIMMAPAQAQTQPATSDPSVLPSVQGQDPAVAKKRAVKKAAPKAKGDADGAAGSTTARGPQRAYTETLPLPRRIDRSEIADPHGSAGGGASEVKPVITPSGRTGLGGRF